MKIFAFIPARKGSERILNKNKILIDNVPLIFYSFAQALQIFDANTIHVSTNDEEIYDWTKKLNFLDIGLRPNELSTSISPDVSWLVHSLENLNKLNIQVSAICLLRPTSPFRSEAFIRDGIKKFKENNHCSSLRAVKKCTEHPGKMWIIKNELMMPILPFSEKDVPWHSMQYKSLPEVYIQTASLELLNVEKTIKINQLAGEIVIPFFGDQLNSFDINNEIDLFEANQLIQKYDNNLKKVAKELYEKCK